MSSLIFLQVLGASGVVEMMTHQPSAAIEFRGLAGAGDDAVHHLQLKIELVDSIHQYENGCTINGDSFSAAGFATFFDTDLGQFGGWVSRVDGGTLLIVGWMDGKTGKLHRVKKAAFTSDDLPRASMPKVTYPEQKKG